MAVLMGQLGDVPHLRTGDFIPEQERAESLAAIRTVSRRVPADTYLRPDLESPNWIAVSRPNALRRAVARFVA